MMTAVALIGVDSTSMEGFQKENVEKLLSEKGFINLDEYRVSIMAAFGYRAGEPRRAKTRQAAGGCCSVGRINGGDLGAFRRGLEAV